MNALTVWQVWRRIMREPALQHALFEAGADGLDAFGLTAAEREAALAYAAQAERAKWFVLNYRFRMTNSFLNALETGAPLVLRVLLGKEVDVRRLGERFLDLHGWKDYGPFVYGYCRDVLEFLLQDPCTESPGGMRALIGLELAVVDLLLGLAPQPGTVESNTPLIRRTGRARHYQARYRLSDWLRDKKKLGRTELEPDAQDYLIYLSDFESAPRFALLPGRAADIMQALRLPCLHQELPARLAAMGKAPSGPDDEKHLALLKANRAICGELD